MTENAFQDYYPDEFNHCYGCGKLNEQGHQLKSRWDGDEAVAYYTPKPFHTAVPGFVYGGLIASLVDCHGTGTASAAAYREEGREMGSQPTLRFVTASLKVDFLAPTPLGPELEVRAKIDEITPKKVIMTIDVKAGDKCTARGTVVAVKIPDTMFK